MTRSRLSLFAAVVLALSAAGCGAGTSSPSPEASPTSHSIVGSIVLTNGAQGAGGQCWGSGGYDDVKGGAQVVVTDQGGQIIATSALQDGLRTSTDQGSRVAECTFHLSVDAVPEAAFYGVEVSHRGRIVHSRTEMDAARWEVRLTLG